MFKVHSKKGFTLIEMIISLAIFSVVATVALGALVRIITANRKAQTLQSSLTNLNFALESMARELRVGDNYSCNDGSFIAYNSDNAGGVLTFIPAPNGCSINNDTNRPTTVIGFRSDRKTSSGTICNLATLYRARYDSSVQSITLQKGEQTVCGAAITDDKISDIIDTKNVVITRYRMGIGPFNGSALTSEYPYVFLRLSGYAKSGERERDRTYFDVQTTISSRTAQLNCTIDVSGTKSCS